MHLCSPSEPAFRCVTSASHGADPPPPTYCLEANERKWVVWQFDQLFSVPASVTTLGDLLDFGQIFKAFGNN